MRELNKTEAAMVAGGCPDEAAIDSISQVGDFIGDVFEIIGEVYVNAGQQIFDDIVDALED